MNSWTHFKQLLSKECYLLIRKYELTRKFEKYIIMKNKNLIKYLYSYFHETLRSYI